MSLAATGTTTQEVCAFLQDRPLVVLTGAGVSHRLRHPRLPRPGLARRLPMTYQRVPLRRRAAPALLGAQPRRLDPHGARRAQRRPPRARRARGPRRVAALITQNVDGLHGAAGSRALSTCTVASPTCAACPAAGGVRAPTCSDGSSRSTPASSSGDRAGAARAGRRRRARRHRRVPACRTASPAAACSSPTSCSSARTSPRAGERSYARSRDAGRGRRAARGRLSLTVMSGLRFVRHAASAAYRW